MNREQLVQEIAEKMGANPRQVEKIVAELLYQIKDFMLDTYPLEFRGFGTFAVKKRSARTARNIVKGTQIKVPACYRILFRPSKKFVKEVQKGEQR